MSTLKVPAQLFRSAQFDRDSVNEENRTVSLSVSSDEPYERYFGTEILSHKSEAVRLKRLKTGGMLLFNHNRDQYLGIIKSASLDGSKMNVTVQFGNSAFAQEKFKDVQDGILTNASIGYEIHKMEEDADEKRFTATDWEPYECSMVTVPADPTVGVGRSEPDWLQVRSKEIEVVGASVPDADPRVRTRATTRAVDNPENSKLQETRTHMAEIASPEKPETKVDVVKERNDAVADFKARCKKIDDFVGAIDDKKLPGWKQTAAEIAKRHQASEADFEAFRTEAVNAFDPAKNVEVPETTIGMSKKERKQFSVRKMILELFTKGQMTGLEKEACESAREQLREAGDNTINDREGFTLPEDISRSSMADDNDLDYRGMDRVLNEVRQLKRGLSASTQNAGGYLVGVDLLTGSIIELLRNKTIIAGLGIRNLDGLVNNVAIPRVTGGGTVGWLAEGATGTASQQAFGQLTLTPHRMFADTFYTKQLLNQASLSVEAFVRDDLVRQMAVELDRVYINGSGVFGEPQGILNTSGVGTVTFSAAVTLAKLLTMESDVATANADLAAQSFITTPATRAKLKAAVAYANTAWPLWGGIGGTGGDMVIGYPAAISNNVPSNKVILGVWSEFIAARWAGLDVVVDPYSLKKSEQIEVTTHQWVDCGIRHPLAFEISTDSGAQ